MMKFLRASVSLLLMALAHVNAQTCPLDGTEPFQLGDHDADIAKSGRRDWMQANWRKQLTGTSTKKVRIKPIGDTDTMVKAANLGWLDLGNSNVLGLGVAQSLMKDYTYETEGGIEGKEGIEVWFAGYIVANVNFGVQLLNLGETGRWYAYLDGQVVKEGTFSGVDTEANDPDGKVSGDIIVTGGFDKVLFAVDDSTSNTNYMLEYVEGCYYDQSGVETGDTCGGPTARFSGDPHLLTFDEVLFDCQGRGEFVMATNGDYNVQARFVLGDNDKRYVTVTKAIVFSIPGEPKIQVEVPHNNDAEICPYTFYVNDAERDIRNLGTSSQTLTAVFSENAVLFHDEATGGRIEVSSKLSKTNGCVLAYQICIPDSVSNIVGLLGTPNDIRSDDWTFPNGTEADIPSDAKDLRFEPAFNYCVNWCLAAAGQESLFLYTGGTTFDDYNFDCEGPYDNTLEEELENVSQEIIDICGDDLACQIDGIIGGIEDANAFLEVEEELDELKEEPPATNVGNGIAIVSGDPHIRTWGGENYDFHGECDLVMLTNPAFKQGLGMDIHVRSTKYRQWAYISSAVLRIGEDTLEVRGRKDNDGHFFWVNGVAANDYEKQAGENKKILLENTLAGYPISVEWGSMQNREFAVDLGHNQKIVFKTWKSFVRIDIINARASDFDGSLGLMGTYKNGIKVGRDMSTVISDPNEFGMEWQVLATEPRLFHDKEGPQAPEQCNMPTTADMRRRLGESVISQEEAMQACSKVEKMYLDICIFDVMATNDRNVAGAY